MDGVGRRTIVAIAQSLRMLPSFIRRIQSIAVPLVVAGLLAGFAAPAAAAGPAADAGASADAQAAKKKKKKKCKKGKRCKKNAPPAQTPAPPAGGGGGGAPHDAPDAAAPEPAHLAAS